MNEIMKKFDEQDVKVYITRVTDHYHSDTPWDINLSRDDGEAKIEISIYGATFEEALRRAFERLVRVSSEGLPLKALPSA